MVGTGELAHILGRLSSRPRKCLQRFAGPLSTAFVHRRWGHAFRWTRVRPPFWCPLGVAPTQVPPALGGGGGGQGTGPTWMAAPQAPSGAATSHAAAHSHSPVRMPLEGGAGDVSTATATAFPERRFARTRPRATAERRRAPQCGIVPECLRDRTPPRVLVDGRSSDPPPHDPRWPPSLVPLLRSSALCLGTSPARPSAARDFRCAVGFRWRPGRASSKAPTRESPRASEALEAQTPAPPLPIPKGCLGPRPAPTPLVRRRFVQRASAPAVRVQSQPRHGHVQVRALAGGVRRGRRPDRPLQRRHGGGGGHHRQSERQRHREARATDGAGLGCALGGGGGGGQSVPCPGPWGGGGASLKGRLLVRAIADSVLK